MNEYVLAKTLHILSSVVLVGTGAGSAFYLFMIYLSRDLAAIRAINRLVVKADRWFTFPTVIFQPLSGYWLLRLSGIPWSAAWIKTSLVLYFIAGLCWIPAYHIQLKLRNWAELATSYQELSPSYHRAMRNWAVLGVIAFLCMVVIYFLMVAKY